jgi:hypothetical protein
MELLISPLGITRQPHGYRPAHAAPSLVTICAAINQAASYRKLFSLDRKDRKDIQLSFGKHDSIKALHTAWWTFTTHKQPAANSMLQDLSTGGSSMMDLHSAG